MNTAILINSDSRYPLDRPKIRHRLQRELVVYKISGNLEISIAVVGSRKMKSLNNTYRQINQPTNVLSFPLVDHLPDETVNNAVQGFVLPRDKTLYLGDIVICYPVARRQAADYHMFVNDWIADLAVHGLQHLLGIHHL
jgi:probable rRNA maturation factor